MMYVVAYTRGEADDADVENFFVAHNVRSARVLAGTVWLVETDIPSALDFAKELVPITGDNAGLLVTELTINTAWKSLLISDDEMVRWEPEQAVVEA